MCTEQVLIEVDISDIEKYVIIIILKLFYYFRESQDVEDIASGCHNTDTEQDIVLNSALDQINSWSKGMGGGQCPTTISNSANFLLIGSDGGVTSVWTPQHQSSRSDNKSRASSFLSVLLLLVVVLMIHTNIALAASLGKSISLIYMCEQTTVI